MEKFKIAMIGCGARSLAYAKPLVQSGKASIVACADPSWPHTKHMLDYAGLDEKSIHYYTDWKELLDKEKELDGAVIATPNNLHHEPAIAVLERGLPLALEKPLTTTMEDSEKLLNVVRRNNSQIILGFVLRSTPFYEIVRQTLDSGRIGRVISIEADELVMPGISSVITRSPWRRFAMQSGGSMMEKSSHDMDLMNWFAGGRPEAVSSFGGSLLFRPNPTLPMKCDGCPASQSCIYYKKPQFSSAAGDAVLQNSLERDLDTCIYNIDKDVYDNQVVSIRYSNGVIVNFTLAFNCIGERGGRNLHIIGSKGRLWGNIDSNQIGVHENLSGETEHIQVPQREGGHNGGDNFHALNLIHMMEDRSFHPAQDAYAGYLSNAICIAADHSVNEERQIHFRYTSDGYIRFK
ncbi:MAG: Gfo/Idh/MocA family oxidoreductase [Victivallales bacterium]|nr:Gfo/Idh/MocA family oxidoreductase [Victivallales bacterium]